MAYNGPAAAVVLIYTFPAFATLGAWLLLTQQPATFFAIGDTLWPWFVVAVLAIGPTLGGYILYAMSLRTLSAGAAGTIVTLEAPFAALISAWLLREWLHWPQIVGLCCVLVGAILPQFGAGSCRVGSLFWMEQKTMTFEEYQTLAKRTMSRALDQREQLTMTALGLVGEAGECSEAIKKHLFHGHPLDRAALARELGDVLWYLTMLADACELELATVAEQNIAKLKARYPDGFSPQSSLERRES